jgi:hypothetical protein
MLSSDSTSENGKKKSLLPNVSFLDEFSQGHTTYAKARLVKKMAPSCHISRKKKSDFTIFI